jgi:hypothetical protein
VIKSGKIIWKNIRGRNHLGDLDIDGIIILKWALWKWEVMD